MDRIGVRRYRGSGPASGGTRSARTRSPSRPGSDLGALGDLAVDGDRQPVGDDVEDRGTHPGLLDQPVQLLVGGVTGNLERNVDALESIADVDALPGNATQIDLADDGGLHRKQ